MTREEALQILNIQDDAKVGDDGHLKENIDPKIVMERFDTLIEKNQVDKGGSFYI